MDLGTTLILVIVIHPLITPYSLQSHLPSSPTTPLPKCCSFGTASSAHLTSGPNAAGWEVLSVTNDLTNNSAGEKKNKVPIISFCLHMSVSQSLHRSLSLPLLLLAILSGRQRDMRSSILSTNLYHLLTLHLRNPSPLDVRLN